MKFIHLPEDEIVFLKKYGIKIIQDYMTMGKSSEVNLQRNGRKFDRKLLNNFSNLLYVSSEAYDWIEFEKKEYKPYF